MLDETSVSFVGLELISPKDRKDLGRLLYSFIEHIRDAIDMLYDESRDQKYKAKWHLEINKVKE